MVLRTRLSESIVCLDPRIFIIGRYWSRLGGISSFASTSSSTSSFSFSSSSSSSSSSTLPSSPFILITASQFLYQFNHQSNHSHQQHYYNSLLAPEQILRIAISLSTGSLGNILCNVLAVFLLISSSFASKMSNRPIFLATHPRSCSTAFERVNNNSH